MMEEKNVPSLFNSSWFRLMQLNAENLFLFMDRFQQEDLNQIAEWEWQKLSSSPVANKNLKKTWELANAIKEVNPDLVLLNEVGGEESLKNFAHHFLDDLFLPLIIEGNSDRGIDVGYLLKKNFNIRSLLISHRRRPLHWPSASSNTYFFSRDVLELRLFQNEEKTPRLICFLTHLKSKLDPDGSDPQGRKRRKAEVETLIRICQEVDKEMNHQVPFIAAGDFNGLAYREKHEDEFISLYNSQETKLHWVELFDLIGANEEKRTTQIQFMRDGSRRLLQLDYFFLSPLLHDKVERDLSFVYRYRDKKGGTPLPLSQTFEQRLQLPSDHYPVVLTIANPFASTVVA